MIDQQGIEENPDKIQAILQMQSLTTIKDMQKLTGCIAALGRFMSRSADKCLPFFKVLKRKTPFVWNVEAEKAFQRLKQYLEKLPWMVSLTSNEPLLLYLAVLDYAMSVVLVVKRNRRQHLVYYVSHLLIEAELRYPLIKKFAYALLIASRKPCPYFESHHVTMMTDHPLRSTLEKYGT